MRGELKSHAKGRMKIRLQRTIFQFCLWQARFRQIAGFSYFINAHLHMVPAKIQESFELLPISQQFRSLKCKIDELLYFLQRLIWRVDDKCVQIQIPLKVIS